MIAQREFRREFGIHRNCVVPSGHAIRTWVRNFEATGSTLKKKGGSVKSVERWLQTARVTHSGNAQNGVDFFQWPLSLPQYSRVYVRTVFTLPPFSFSVEPVASKFRTQVLIAWPDGTAQLR